MSDAAPDRFVARVLSLPIFDRSFANAIRRSPFGSVAFVSAMEARSGSEFTDKIWALAGSLDSDTLEAFQEESIPRDVFTKHVLWRGLTLNQPLFNSGSVFVNTARSLFSWTNRPV